MTRNPACLTLAASLVAGCVMNNVGLDERFGQRPGLHTTLIEAVPAFADSTANQTAGDAHFVNRRVLAETTHLFDFEAQPEALEQLIPALFEAVRKDTFGAGFQVEAAPIEWNAATSVAPRQAVATSTLDFWAQDKVGTIELWVSPTPVAGNYLMRVHYSESPR